MSITVRTHQSSGSFDVVTSPWTYTMSFAAPVLLGSLLLLWVSEDALPAGTVSVSDNLNGAWTRADAAAFSQSVSYDVEGSLWYVYTTGGSPSVVIEWEAAPDSFVFAGCIALEITGVKGGVVATVVGDETGSSHGTGSISTLPKTFLVSGFCDWGQDTNYTISDPQWAFYPDIESNGTVEAVVALRGSLNRSGSGGVDDTAGVAPGTYSLTATTVDDTTHTGHVLVAFAVGATSRTDIKFGTTGALGGGGIALAGSTTVSFATTGTLGGGAVALGVATIAIIFTTSGGLPQVPISMAAWTADRTQGANIRTRTIGRLKINVAVVPPPTTL